VFICAICGPFYAKQTQFITAKRSEDGLHVLLLQEDTPKSTFLSKANFKANQTQFKPNFWLCRGKANVNLRNL